LINFSLLPHRSFEAVVNADVNAKRLSSLAIGIIVLNLLATSITLTNDLTFYVCSLNIFISHNALLKLVTLDMSQFFENKENAFSKSFNVIFELIGTDNTLKSG